MRSPPSPNSDPTFSLRELALKTLKSRRKPQPDSPLSVLPVLPARPPPSSDLSFQLDYGQDEYSAPHDIPQTPVLSTSKSPLVSTPNPPAKLPEPKPAPVPDNQAREEGEISDEEESQPTPVQPKPSTPLPPPPSSIPRSPRHSTPSTSAPAPPDTSKNKPPLYERLSDPPIISNSLTFTASEASNAMHIDPAPLLPNFRHLLDPDHVRPGVTMNQDQYDKAKDIVLDLLGWGVDPTYLVDCGVTREVVYYVFTELNLRLPQNLDTTGLLPFTPEDALELQKSAMMPPPPPPARHSAPLSGRTPSPSPATPLARLLTTSQALESPKPVSTSDLHNMEQQRRQELMARKAAIASKKSKQLPPSTTSSPPRPPSSLPSSSQQDTDMNVDTVDDFLKSIGSSSVPGHIAGDSSIAAFQPNVDDMDVDEIPGLRRTNLYKAPAPARHASSSVAFSSPSMVSPTQSSQDPLSPTEAPPSSTESGSTTFSSRSTDTSLSSSSIEIRLPEGPALQRRGMRRPVASDFVDFDNDSRASSTNGYRNSNGNMRRRAPAPGFASLANQPRCIIDLSDSEGEVDADVQMRGVETSWRPGGYASPVPTKPFVAHLNTNGWATPPVSTLTPTIASTASTPNGTMSPAALVAKETEIQRMRAMIAHKERKLKEAKVALEANKMDVNVKREETPVIISSDDNGQLATMVVPPQPSAPEGRLDSSVSSDPASVPRSSEQDTPVTTTSSIGSPFRLALPTSD
ncbi:hypothetical protein C0991_010295 [Blastosporella zonata]|nr:hypothetical protein C0991_010295 [Blastosporella zonata]